MENTVKKRQFELKVGKTPVLKTTTPEAQSEILATQRALETTLQSKYEAAQSRYEAARILSQDKIQMELLQKLKNGGRELMSDHEVLLQLAQKILAGDLKFGLNGWVESAEKPEQNEQ